MGLAFFLGGQLVLVTAIVPVARGHVDEAAMRAIARRFGIGSAVALAVLVATGAALASHADRWQDNILQVKLMVLVLVGVLIGLHVTSPNTRALSVGTLLATLLIAWLGVKLAHG